MDDDIFYKDRIVSNTQVYIANVQDKMGKVRGTVHKGLVLESPVKKKF